MKKKLLISFSIVITLAIVIALYTQIWKPLTLYPLEAECIVWDATYDAAQAQAEMVLSGEYDKTMFFIHSFKDKLPSDNPDDYMTIYCTIRAKNRSVFHINSLKAVVFDLDNYEENVLFSDSSDSVIAGPIWRHTTSDETFRLKVYVGDMDETAVRELVKGLTAKVTYEGDFTGIREKLIDFSECETVTVEFQGRSS